MRVTNLILHIVTLLLMLPDALFIGLSALVSLPYLDGIEIIEVPVFFLLFFTGFFFSLIGGIMQFAGYRKAPVKKYMKREVLIHGLAALSFGLMIAYTLILILNPAPKIPELSTDSSNVRVSVIDIAGFALAIAGIVFTLVAGTIKIKKAAAAAGAQRSSRPRFCTVCGMPTGETGDFCRNCGTKLI